MIPSPNSFAGLWAGWGLLWMALARRTARTVSAQSAPSRALHLGLIAAGAVLVFLHVTTPALLAVPLLTPHASLAWADLALAVLGIGFAVMARAHLGRQWSGTVTLKEDHALVRSGPYGLTRHPIYTGLLTALLGTALFNGSVAAALGFGLVALACLLKVRLEEQVLQAHFGARYAAYRREVRALIPFLW